MPGTHAPPLERLLRRTTLVLHPDPRFGSCWISGLAKNRGAYATTPATGGYAVIRDERGRMVSVHRLGFRLLRGDPGPILDHRCRVHACWNPDHLEPVTQAENVARGVGHGTETHCPAGHPYDAANTYVDRLGKRYCRACKRGRDRQRCRSRGRRPCSHQ